MSRQGGLQRAAKLRDEQPGEYSLQWTICVRGPRPRSTGIARHSAGREFAFRFTRYRGSHHGMQTALFTGCRPLQLDGARQLRVQAPQILRIDADIAKSGERIAQVGNGILIAETSQQFQHLESDGQAAVGNSHDTERRALSFAEDLLDHGQTHLFPTPVEPFELAGRVDPRVYL